MLTTEVSGQMLTRMETSCFGPDCLTCSLCAGTLSGTEGLHRTGRGVTSLINPKSAGSSRTHWALIPFRKFLWWSKIWTTSLNQASCMSGDAACMMKRATLPSFPREVRTRQHRSSSVCSSTPRQLTCSVHTGAVLLIEKTVWTKHDYKYKVTLTLMLFLKVYPGNKKPFFLSIGSLKMTSCSNRKTRLSLALVTQPLSCSLTEKVSCWSSFPWAVILPWNNMCVTNTVRHPGNVFSLWWEIKILFLTSKPWSRPTFIISLQRFGTKHITSTALWGRTLDEGRIKKWKQKIRVQRNMQNMYFTFHNELVPAAPQHPFLLYCSTSGSPADAKQREDLTLKFVCVCVWIQQYKTWRVCHFGMISPAD